MNIRHSPLLFVPLLFAAVSGPALAGDSASPGLATKPTAPIGISWDLSGEPRVGQPLEIALTIEAEVELAAAELTLGVDDPLALIDPAERLALGNLAPGVPVAVVVTVLPLVAETQYLRVAVAGQSGGLPQLRTVSVPLRFEAATGDKDAGVAPARPAEALRSFDAVETVR